MATYKQFRLGELGPAQAGFGLLGPDCRSVYPTEAEAEVAREAINAALTTAIAVVTPRD